MRIILTILIGLVGAAPALAEQIECHSNDFSAPGYAYRVDAERDQVKVWSRYVPTDDPYLEADVLEFWHAQPEGSLRQTIAFVQMRTQTELLAPSMLVIDWATGSMAHAYRPFLIAPDNMVVSPPLQCVRLD
jgi:hypothetical protein|tara:strand:- start:164 stop:559 length:396 start_codon:yes stop_codon:yes gene_type:complete